MTLEQQVANLVNATTGLTNVVNDELESVRAENNTFKTSALANIDDRFNTFISGFDQVKLRNSAFTIYVDPVSGVAFPVNPVDNESDPFNTIANAVIFLNGYYWTNGTATIRLSAGNHVVNNTISISHPCPIRIEGATSPDFNGVQAIVSQTTSANRSANVSIAGSNANLFNHLISIFQSCIVYSGTLSLFRVTNARFTLRNCLLYTQNKDLSSIGISVDSSADATISNSAFMYFSTAVQSFNVHLSFEGFVLLSANSNGYINYGSAANGLLGSTLYFSGNEGIGFHNTGTAIFRGNTSAYGNGSHGFYCFRGILNFLTGNTAVSNGGCGFYVVYGGIDYAASSSQNNGQYGFRADGGIIRVIGSDTLATGNLFGKKLENNTQQAYVTGVNA
jgi:hypothetical protein